MTQKVKYPRTFHLPWSEGATSDDKTLSSVAHFVGKEVVVTEKMDGENTSLYRDGIHARSLDSASHESQSFVRALQAKIGWQIPEDYRLCGENLLAKHTIHYTDLASYFYLFSVWDRDLCLSWDDTQTWAKLLGLSFVPVLWRGIWDEKAIRSCFTDRADQEGYVVRLAGSFWYSDFAQSVAKFVRKGHVLSGESHWKSRAIVPNLLKVKVDKRKQIWWLG